MVGYEEIRKRYFYEGVELASFVGRYPLLEGCQHISKFYEELTKSSFAWFCGELCETLKAEYETYKNTKKRFYNEVCRYEVDFSAAEEKDVISVSCNVTLKKGKKRVLARFSEVQRWDPECQMMIRSRKKHGAS